MECSGNIQKSGFSLLKSSCGGGGVFLVETQCFSSAMHKFARSSSVRPVATRPTDTHRLAASLRFKKYVGKLKLLIVDPTEITGLNRNLYTLCLTFTQFIRVRVFLAYTTFCNKSEHLLRSELKYFQLLMY